MHTLTTWYVNTTGWLVSAQGSKGGSKNPWDFVNGPSFGPFSGLLQNRAGQLLALVWLVAMFLTAYFLLVNLAKLGRAKGSSRPGDVAEVRGDLAWSAVSAVAVVSAPAIYAAIAAF